MKEAILKLLLVLILILCILLCLPKVAESAVQATSQAETPEPVKTTPAAVIPVMAAETPAPSQQILYKATAVLKEEPICTDAEKKIIAKVVNAEARGECFEGQVLVAVVVIKRYESGRFGQTIKAIAYADHQFANGSIYNAENMEAVEQAIENLENYPDNLFFFQRADRKFWGGSHSIKKYCRVGNHTFYVQE